MRGPISSKSDTCTEGVGVNAAGISVKVGAHYPGRSVDLPCATAVERRREGSTEVSRGHSRSFDRTEGPNVKCVTGALNFDEEWRRGQPDWDARHIFGGERRESARTRCLCVKPRGKER